MFVTYSMNERNLYEGENKNYIFKFHFPCHRDPLKICINFANFAFCLCLICSPQALNYDA